MTEEPRETLVLGAVVALVDSLLGDFDVVELLTELTERCAELLDVSATGLLLADPGGHLHLIAATAAKSRDLELFQLQVDQGPCLDCYATGQPVSTVDLTAAAQRWPAFAPAAVQAGFASVHAVPLRGAGTALGALGLFGTSVGELNDADQLVAQTFAHIAGVAILQEHPTLANATPHLQRILMSRIHVEQAKGFLREHFDIPVDEAFTLLRRYARLYDDQLTQVARRLVAEPDARPAILARLRRLVSGSSASSTES